MPKNRKPELYALLKETGAPLSTTYTKYTMSTLLAELNAQGVDLTEVMAEDIPLPEEPKVEYRYTETPPPQTSNTSDVTYTATTPRQAQADPDEMPGQRLNTKPEDQPIRIDEQGRAWFQEEVRKPAYPKPRGRRVLKYLDTGVKTETVQNGEYIETFEVAGIGTPHAAEVKITLPSYQVGIYKDPRFPFRIHCYNGREGFNLFEVHAYYGGAELVPAECKRVYIENDLCYDVRSVVRTIQTEHRQLQLAGKL